MSHTVRHRYVASLHPGGSPRSTQHAPTAGGCAYRIGLCAGGAERRVPCMHRRSGRGRRDPARVTTHGSGTAVRARPAVGPAVHRLVSGVTRAITSKFQGRAEVLVRAHSGIHKPRHKPGNRGPSRRTRRPTRRHVHVSHIDNPASSFVRAHFDTSSRERRAACTRVSPCVPRCSSMLLSPAVSQGRPAPTRCAHSSTGFTVDDHIHCGHHRPTLPRPSVSSSSPHSA